MHVKALLHVCTSCMRERGRMPDEFANASSSLEHHIASPLASCSTSFYQTPTLTLDRDPSDLIKKGSSNHPLHSKKIRTRAAATTTRLVHHRIIPTRHKRHITHYRRQPTTTTMMVMRPVVSSIVAPAAAAVVVVGVALTVMLSCQSSTSNVVVDAFTVVPKTVVIYNTNMVQKINRQRQLSPSSSLHMFTGIVEEMGVVQSLVERDDMELWDGSKGHGTELTVQGNVVLDGAYLGCSICVSGVCLTATALDPVQRTFKVGLAPETLRKTYFGSLQAGQSVNLERASEIGGRNSGHFVQGHVDGTGTIIHKQLDQDSLAITIQLDNPDLIKYIVPKGFIAIDGTSLTVVDVDPVAKTFSFMLIEYTQKKIVIPQKQVGEKVNLEVDVLGKYSETALAALMPRLEALEAKVESLERALAGPPPPSSRSAPPPRQQQQQAPESYDTAPARSMIPTKTYQPRPKSTSIGPMGGVPRATSSYLQNEAEEFRRSGAPMTRPMAQDQANGGAIAGRQAQSGKVAAAAAAPKSAGSYLDQLGNDGGNSSPQKQTQSPPQEQQQQQQQQKRGINLNPEPPMASQQGQRRRFTSTPTGKGVPNTLHSQESLPDPLL